MGSKNHLSAVFGMVFTVAAAAILGTLSAPTIAGSLASTPTSGQSNGQSANPWSALTIQDAWEVESYKELKDATAAANATILGTVRDVALGEQFVETEGPEVLRSYLITLTVNVDQALTGKIEGGGTTVRVEFGPFDGTDVNLADFQSLVGEQSVYLLRRKGSALEGRWARDPEQLADNVYRVVTFEGLLDENEDGTVEAPLTNDPGFSKDVEGDPFDALVRRVDAQG